MRDWINVVVASPMLVFLLKDHVQVIWQKLGKLLRSDVPGVRMQHGENPVKHLFSIAAGGVAAVVSWLLLAVAEIPAKELIAGFLAVWIGVTVELIVFLFIERSSLLKERRETNSKIATIENLQNQAVPKFEEAKAEAKAIQQHMSSLEKSITHGLLAKSLDDPANVWKNVLEDACRAQHSIYVAITVPDFSAPREWDESLSDSLKRWKDAANDEIHYRVAIYHPLTELGDEDVRKLRSINDIYRSKNLESAIHGFIDQLNYFNFNVVIIDGKSVGFLWNSHGGGKSTKGIYFGDAPELAGELNGWFLHTCRQHFKDIRELDTRKTQHLTDRRT
jgi:hypothetical protein